MSQIFLMRLKAKVMSVCKRWDTPINIADAKYAAAEAIKINSEAYQEAGINFPPSKPVKSHLENPDFADLLFAYIDVFEAEERLAA